MTVESSTHPLTPPSTHGTPAITERTDGVRTRMLAGGALLLFLLVGLWYSLVVPPFETPDEVFHYAFARHLAAGNPLPIQEPEVEAPWEQEGSQAPLYYWLVGRLTAAIDQGDFAAISVRNPRANIGDPLFPGNKNFMLYSAAAHPLVGVNLALHIGRWFSLLLGLLTLIFTYLTARLVFPRSPQLPLLVLLIVAFIPQFTFISAALTNDNLINAAAAAVIYWLARLMGNTELGIRNTELGGRAAVRWWEWVVLGVLLGVAALSKLQGLGLGLLSGLAMLYLAWQRRDWRLPLRAFLPVAMPVLIIAGWWYWRNFNLYGDWTGVAHLLANNGRRQDPLTLMSFWREFRGLRYSFWGLFGWFNILLPQWLYVLLDAITLLALTGLAWRFIERKSKPATHSLQPATRNPQPITLLLTTWAFLSVALLLYWTWQATGSQGRLLFPAIGALVILLVVGLDQWFRLFPVRMQPALWLILPALLFGASLYALFVLIPRSYQAPAPIGTMPASATPLDVRYGESDQLRLLGIDLPTGRYTVGEYAPVTLYLQAPVQVDDDFQLFIQFLDENRVEVGNLTSHPGWGRNPTSLWQPGAIYADSYPVLIDQPIADWTPLLAQVYVGFVDPKTEESGRLPIPAYNAAGDEIVPFVGQVTIAPTTRPYVADLVEHGAQFGNVIQLSGYHLSAPSALVHSGSLTVTLQWDAIGAPATDYTAFVQLRDANGQPVAGFDQEPAAQRFPTHAWRGGDRIVSQSVLALPASLAAGQYGLWVGLYETGSQGAIRLPVTGHAGQRRGDGEVWLEEIWID